jgi:hypothetical protein
LSTIAKYFEGKLYPEKGGQKLDTTLFVVNVLTAVKLGNLTDPELKKTFNV